MSQLRAGQLADPLAALPPPAPVRRPVNVRSVLLGLAGVVFLCGLTAYNDYVVGNTFMIGNFLPIGLLLFFVLAVLLVNAPLWKLAPRLAFSGGELAVALGMTLVSAALPSSGLMRYLPSHLVGVWHHAAQNRDYADVTDRVISRAAPGRPLAGWVFPDLRAGTTRERANEDVVRNYIGRTPIEGTDFRSRLAAVPWRAWLKPAVAWGGFFAALYGAVLCGSVVLRRQWVENERLAFPLAEIYASLIETPRPGHALNDLLRSRGFWLAAATVFLIHANNALFLYFPRTFPEIPLRYDISGLLTERPWSYTNWSIRTSSVYFSIIAVTFFLQSKVALSLWAFYLMAHVAHMLAGVYQTSLTPAMQTDQMFGAMLPITVTILWVGRHQWALVLRHMLGRAGPAEPNGRYLPYRLAGWGLLTCVLLAGAWMWAAGATAGGAAVCILTLLTSYLVMAKVVAETGLIFVNAHLPPTHPWLYAPIVGEPGDFAVRTTLRSYFLTAIVGAAAGRDLREALSVFATHALRVADERAYSQVRDWRRAIPFTAALAGALVVGFLLSGASMLFVEYNYASMQDTRQAMVNTVTMESHVKTWGLDPVRDYAAPGGQKVIHSRWGHFTFGAALTTLLSIGRLRWVGWPLHPVGFLLCYTWPMGRIWFSVFIGWLAKVLIVRFGGTQLFRTARNFAIGLILGEVGAAGFWLIVSLVLNALGMEYRAVNLLPT